MAAAEEREHDMPRLAGGLGHQTRGYAHQAEAGEPPPAHGVAREDTDAARGLLPRDHQPIIWTSEGDTDPEALTEPVPVQGVFLRGLAPGPTGAAECVRRPEGREL